ncbi:secondary thiamine-phosphate synthase enzyme YjbQ [Nanoarchaeota archaeon]
MEFTISTTKRQELIDITHQVVSAVKESGVSEGLCNVYVSHATAAIAINENDDPNICLDIIDALDDAIPHGKWRHDQVDNNAAAHIKASVIGPSETIPVKDGKLLLGTWQAIMLCCFDGPRERHITVTILKNQ